MTRFRRQAEITAVSHIHNVIHNRQIHIAGPPENKIKTHFIIPHGVVTHINTISKEEKLGKKWRRVSSFVIAHIRSNN